MRHLGGLFATSVKTVVFTAEKIVASHPEIGGLEGTEFGIFFVSLHQIPFYSMKKILLSLALALAVGTVRAQMATDSYEELTDTKPHTADAVWDRLPAAPQTGWGTTDVRYKKWETPAGTTLKTARMKGWRGERVHAQALIWTRSELSDVRLAASALRSGKNVIPATAVKAGFVRYVMTDEYNKTGNSNCGHRPNKADWDSSIVADPIGDLSLHQIPARSTRPVWLSVWIPADAKPGTYNGTLTISGANFKSRQLPFQVVVTGRLLPSPDQWKFNLDLWQSPYAVARYYNVPLWSQAHFDAMRPIMKMLANAGQKSITASIMHMPWNGQTEDPFYSMVTRTKCIDGTWKFDYSVFDRWVEFMTNEVGIHGLISCYTMIPWALQFDYFDQASNSIKFVHAKPQEPAYRDYWLPFLADFSQHLRQKGWFERTAISMDERSMADMQAAISIIREADRDYKITLAGGYHKEIEEELFYLSVPFSETLTPDIIGQRRDRGQVSTYYICCTETFPNTFTFADPAEAAWIPVHALAQDYDGVLRWAYNSWVSDPLRDSRFRSWPAGDTYLVYPGPRTSIRFERLVEGIQNSEKARLLRQELTAKGDKKGLQRLNESLKPFSWEGLKATSMPAREMVKRLEDALNAL